MPASNFARRQSSPLMRGLIMLTVLVVGGIGTVASLWAAGYVDLAFLRPEGVDHGDKVQVLLSAVPIPAYTRVTRDHMINPQTKQAAAFWLAKEQVPPGALTDLSQIAGRVLKYDKAEGYFFTEDDFLPPGTRPGLVGGTPPGKRAMTLDATKIQGVSGLKDGDRLDIVASVALDSRGRGSNFGALAPAAGAVGRPAKEAKVELVVDNGVVVLPVYTRLMPSTTHSLTNGAQTSTKPIQEIVIAVEPNEVPKLTEAFAVGAELVAVARSGLPEETHETKISTEQQEPPKVQVIETIIGKRRAEVAVQLPKPAKQDQ